jgi:DNA invertase Pin-like site-specific DNA recombinase
LRRKDQLQREALPLVRRSRRTFHLSLLSFVAAKEREERKRKSKEGMRGSSSVGRLNGVRRSINIEYRIPK